MSSSEVLDMALRIYQRMGLTFLRLTAVPALLCLAAVGFIVNYVLPGLFTTKGSGDIGQVASDVSTTLVLAVFVGGPLLLIGISYSSAVVVHLVSDYMVGNVPDPEAAVTTARKILPKLFAVNLKQLLLSLGGVALSTAVMVLGSYLKSVTPDTDAIAGIVSLIGVLGLLGGVVVFLSVVASHALVAPIAVLESADSKAAGKRSRELLKKAGYHPAGRGTIWTLYLVLLFIAVVLESGIYSFMSVLNIEDRLSTLLAAIPGEQLIIRAFDLVPQFLVIWTLIPVWASVITIVYYERRIRLEGFDIDALAFEIARQSSTNRFELG